MNNNNLKQFKNRRSFLRGSLATGAAVMGAGALSEGKLFAAPTPPPTSGDVAILRFLAAAELIESDLWQQYAELGGLTPGQEPVETDPSFVPMNSYQNAFMQLDPDGPQYVSSNNGDEQSHAAFLNAYLQYVSAAPVDLDEFRTLPSS
jgi:TAT (twin-arginine translocation) pathway signal sequence